jgi:restriction system protein
MDENLEVPSFDQLMIPTIKALKQLGGSGTINEINEKVFELSNIPDEILQIPHSETDPRTKVEYRLAWARTYLKKYGLLDNSERGVWTLTSSEVIPEVIEPNEVVRFVRDKDKKNKEIDAQEPDLDTQDSIEGEWKSKLLKILSNISPDAFERLAQRVLRECGFTQVEVTGKSGDGGIDGKGILKIGGIISFHIIFQCKRYKGSISPGQIRDFRGAMSGRADKGIFITTGTFSKDARKEASRDGAPPIDLIDGETLCDKMKELELGIEVKQIIEIKEHWFAEL